MTQHQASYIHRNDNPREQYTPIDIYSQSRPAMLTKRIGSTTFRVRIHFSNTSRETVNEKILRLVKSEVVNN